MSGEAVSRSRGSPHKAPGEAPSAQRTRPHARKGALWTQIAYDKRSGLIAFGKVNFPPGSNVFCLMGVDPGTRTQFPWHGCELLAHNPSVLGDFGSHEWLVTRAGSGGVSLTSLPPRSGVRILRGCLQGLKAATCISSRPQGTGPTTGTRNRAVHICEPLSLGQPFPS